MRYGSTSPGEYDVMDPAEATALAERIGRSVEADRELWVTLAKFVAGAKIRAQGEEVR